MSETPWTKGPREGDAADWYIDWHGLENTMGDIRQRNSEILICENADEANARLIAAAPDMAEALAEISAALHQIARDRDLWETELAFMNRVDAALAKARGQA